MLSLINMVIFNNFTLKNPLLFFVESILLAFDYSMEDYSILKALIFTN